MSAPWPACADLVGETLHSLRMSGAFYAHSEFTAPWGMAIPVMNGCMMLHLVLSGQCWVAVKGSELRLLEPGDLALVPHGDGHQLMSESGARMVDLFDIPREVRYSRYEILRDGGGGAVTTLVCAVVHFDHPAAQHFVTLLPRMIFIESHRLPEAEWVQSTLRFMASEAKELRPGGETVITRLADILVIQILRLWMNEKPEAQHGWFRALHDKQIGRVISLIHGDPARTWTVEALANEAAMSRSAFAARFTELVGEPAMHYVARARMYLAHTWLKENNMAIAELAPRLGYQSEAAFSRAFKRFIGFSPGMVRQPVGGSNGCAKSGSSTPVEGRRRALIEM